MALVNQRQKIIKVGAFSSVFITNHFASLCNHYSLKSLIKHLVNNTRLLIRPFSSGHFIIQRCIKFTHRLIRPKSVGSGVERIAHFFPVYKIWATAIFIVLTPQRWARAKKNKFLNWSYTVLACFVQIATREWLLTLFVSFSS